jgi:hypothetical protein
MLDAIEKITAVGKAIYDQAQLVKKNGKRCRTLANRINILMPALEELKKRPNLSTYRPALDALSACLVECQNLIQLHTNPSRTKAFIRFLKADSIDETFKDLTERLETSRNDLGLVGILNLTDRAQDQRERDEDRASLDTIIEGIEAVATQVEEARGETKDHFDSARRRQLDIQEQNRQIKAAIEKNNKDAQEAIQGLIKICQSVALPSLAFPASERENKTVIAIKSAEAYYEEGKQLINAKKFDQAQKAFELAASQGYTKALTYLGIILLDHQEKMYNPDSPNPDVAHIAHQYLFRAALLNDPRGMMRFAHQLEHGEGVKKNLQAALFWYKAVEALGSTSFLPNAQKAKVRVEAEISQPALLLEDFQNYDSGPSTAVQMATSIRSNTPGAPPAKLGVFGSGPSTGTPASHATSTPPTAATVPSPATLNN